MLDFLEKNAYNKNNKSGNQASHLTHQEENPLPELLSPKGGLLFSAYGQALHRTTSQSASQTAPLVGEPLAKPFTLRGLPKPLLQGEVARRRRDGEVVQRRALLQRSGL